MPVKKLTKKNFYDVYGISLLFNKIPNEKLLPLILPIAQKYVDIVKDGCRYELQHFFTSFIDGEEYCCTQEQVNDRMNCNSELIKELRGDKKSWLKIRTTLELDEIVILFREGDGLNIMVGISWGNIAESGLDLEISIQKENLSEIIRLIDRINDLEHNSNLFLQDYATLDLMDALDLKFEAKECEIFRFCSTEIKKLFNKSKSIVAQFH